MLRVKRLALSELSESTRELCLSLNAWNAELSSHVGAASAALLPEAELSSDGQWINLQTRRRGEFSECTREAVLEDAEAGREFTRQCEELRAYLEHDGPLDDPALEPQREKLLQLLTAGRHFCLFEKKSPLLLPYETLDEERVRMSAPIPPKAAAAAVTVKKHGCLCPLLGLLLPLLLLLLLWWFVLYPWPFSGTLRAALDDFLNRSGISAWIDDGQSERQQQQIDDLQRQLDEAEKKRLEDEEAARLKADEDQRRLDEAMAQKQAAEEALKKQQEEAALKDRQAREQKKLQETKAPAKTSAKALPKCKAMKQEGKLPKMVIAFDGSQSMLIDDVRGSGGMQSRLTAATSAASSLVSSIDKNVEIGLVEINGCPTAKSRGFFSGTQRQALRQTISGIDPMRYDGKTPLISGLQQIASMTDGVDADALGILISDGEDTCPMTGNLDVCQVARAIHNKKPKLKIHTILIGEDAGQAACIARVTGGKVFSPQNAGEIKADLQASGSEMKKVCED